MITNNHNVALPMAIWLISDDYVYGAEPNIISTTTLMRSPRYIIASIRAMFPEKFPEELRLTPVEQDMFSYDIQDRVASRIGTAIHSSVDTCLNTKYKSAMLRLGYAESVVERILVNPEPEQIKPENVCIYTEKRSYRDIDGFTVSGQFDAVVDGTVHDIKTTSTFSYTSGCNDKKYIIQGSIYRWLNPGLITGNEIVINFLFTDWNKNYAFSREDYPKARATSKSYPLWSLEQTELYIQDKIAQLKQYWNSPLWEVPCCTEEDLYSGSSVVYKYYKTGYEEGKRSTRNFDNLAEATLYRSKQGGIGEIREERGKPFKCPCCDVSSPNFFSTGSVNISELEIE